MASQFDEMNAEQYTSFFVEAFAHSSKCQTLPVSPGNPGFTRLIFWPPAPSAAIRTSDALARADGQSSAVQWVNLLSIFALSLARACVATLKDDVETYIRAT